MKMRHCMSCLLFISLSTNILAQSYAYGPPMYPGIWNSVVYLENKSDIKFQDTTYRYLQIYEDSTYQLLLYLADKNYTKERVVYYEYGYLDANQNDWTLVRLYHHEAPNTTYDLSSEDWFNVRFNSKSNLLITRQFDIEEMMNLQYPISDISTNTLDNLHALLNWHQQMAYPASIDTTMILNQMAVDSTWAYDVEPRIYNYTYFPESYFKDWGGSEVEYYLSSTLPPKRTAILSGSSFRFELDSGDSLDVLKTLYLEGDFLGKSGNSLLFNTSLINKRKETDLRERGSIEFWQESGVKNYDYKNNPRIFEVDATKTISIQCRSSRHEKVDKVSNVVAYISAFATFYLAPLLSLNYKTGKINSATYLTVAGIGLAGLAISLPMTHIFRSKKYHLAYNEPYSNMYDDNWRIYKRFKNKKDRTK